MDLFELGVGAIRKRKSRYVVLTQGLAIQPRTTAMPLLATRRVQGAGSMLRIAAIRQPSFVRRHTKVLHIRRSGAPFVPLMM